MAGAPVIQSDDTRQAGARTARRPSVVIISLPFERVVRVSLSELVLGALRAHHDIVIVAPFADSEHFQRSFGGPNTHFVHWKAPKFGAIANKVFAASEIARRNGYYRRHRRSGMAYYVANELSVFSEDGNDTRVSGLRAAVFRGLGNLGRWQALWGRLERALGRGWFSLPELDRTVADYDRVTLVQSANWGDQDRALARLSAERSWRRVLLPYTTDQLDVNGYLINDFDVVCAQGPFEVKCATELHHVPPSRVARLGSAWLRHLRSIKHSVVSDDGPAERNMVLYAGAAPLYFPRSSELQGVEVVADLLARSYPHLRLVYRPVEDDAGKRAEVERHCARWPHVTVQWPAATEIGLDRYSGQDHVASLRRFVRGIAGCRLMVMSNVTSLAIDVAAVEECGVISNRFDPTGLLTRRSTALLHRPWFSSIRFTETPEDLSAQVQALLDDPEAGRAAADALVADWDFREEGFEARLLEAVSYTGRETRVAR